MMNKESSLSFLKIPVWYVDNEGHGRYMRTTMGTALLIFVVPKSNSYEPLKEKKRKKEGVFYFY